MDCGLWAGEKKEVDKKTGPDEGQQLLQGIPPVTAYDPKPGRTVAHHGA